MGDFEKASESGYTTETKSNRTQIIAVLMALIAFLAPVTVAGYDYGYDFYLSITAMLWSIYMDGYSVRLQFIGPYSMITMIPFLMFRIGFVYQITRYYQGKTTRGRTVVAAVLSEAPFLALYVLWLITFAIYGVLGLNFPLPIMMIVGLLLLWRSPVSEATVPWEGADEPTPWWEEKRQEKTEPPVCLLTLQ
jgi:hypothetical protein